MHSGKPVSLTEATLRAAAALDALELLAHDPLAAGTAATRLRRELAALDIVRRRGPADPSELALLPMLVDRLRATLANVPERVPHLLALRALAEDLAR